MTSSNISCRLSTKIWKSLASWTHWSYKDHSFIALQHHCNIKLSNWSNNRNISYSLIILISIAEQEEKRNPENIFHFSHLSRYQCQVEHSKWHTYAQRHWQIYWVVERRRNKNKNAKRFPPFTDITMHCDGWIGGCSWVDELQKFHLGPDRKFRASRCRTTSIKRDFQAPT